MRVGVDARHLGAGRGVARHLECVLRALGEAYPDDEWLAFAPGRRPLPAPGAPAVRLVRHPLPSRALFGAAAVCGRPRLDRLLGGRLDAVWAPAPAPLAVSGGVPLVLTVHDRSFEARPQDFTPYERAWHRLARPRALAARAALVLTDTAVVRDELLAAGWPLAAERVRVVPPGPGLAVRESAVPQPHPALPERYLLFVGALEPRKGVGVLLDAYARARAQGLDAALVLAGAGRLAARAATQDGVLRLGAVSDAALDDLYAGALALVAPSLHEGFGLPALEAALRGTPAVLSDLPVFAETLGEDGAVRVGAGDAGALCAALVRIAGDAALRERVARAGAAAAQRYSWRAAAEGVRAALAEAAGA